MECNTVIRGSLRVLTEFILQLGPHRATHTFESILKVRPGGGRGREDSKILGQGCTAVCGILSKVLLKVCQIFIRPLMGVSGFIGFFLYHNCNTNLFGLLCFISLIILGKGGVLPSIIVI
jgi:hypothetical protein